jgi:site-specific recombinase XerD
VGVNLGCLDVGMAEKFLEYPDIHPVFQHMSSKAEADMPSSAYEALFCLSCLEQGVQMFIIKRWLGHTSIKTTCIYLHASPEMLLNVTSPLDSLMKEDRP